MNDLEKIESVLGTLKELELSKWHSKEDSTIRLFVDGRTIDVGCYFVFSEDGKLTKFMVIE
jgi:hypothetical protein